MIVLETDRLILREVTADDAAFVLELLNSEGFIQNIGDRGVRTEDEARTYIEERVVGSYKAHGFGMWLAVERDGGASVALAGLVRREGLDVPDVGYALVERAWGKGYAQEAAAGVVHHARMVMGIDSLAAITSPGNHASMAVLRKVGFTDRGLIQLPGHPGDSTYFTAP